jgi:type IV pilus assembly protein PilA
MKSHKQSKISGFTLIELMVVIAILSILMSIAIPNFIKYRNKPFCTAAEKDAQSIAAAIVDYFGIAGHTDTPNTDDLNAGKSITLSGGGGFQNTATISGLDPNRGITITVTDRSGRCPIEYQTPAHGWDGNYVYTKRIEQ